MKKTYKIPVTWQMCDYLEVEADSLEMAVKYVEDNLDEFPLGEDAEYVDGSYMITGSDDFEDEDLVDFIRDCTGE